MTATDREPAETPDPAPLWGRRPRTPDVCSGCRTEAEIYRFGRCWLCFATLEAREWAKGTPAVDLHTFKDQNRPPAREREAPADG